MEPKLALDQMADRLVRMGTGDISWKQIRQNLEDIYINELHEYHDNIMLSISLASKMEKLDKAIQIAKTKKDILERKAKNSKVNEYGEYGMGGDWWKQ